MGLSRKLKFIKNHPEFIFSLLKLRRVLANAKRQGKQLWVLQCDFKGHFPYLRPIFEYSRNIKDVEIYFAIGNSIKDNPYPFLIEYGIPEDHIIYPIDYLRFTDWDVYISPTEWGNVFPRNSDCLRIQIFHTLADKKIEYSKELLKFNTLFANGPIHHEFMEKYIFRKYPTHRKNCNIINTGFAKIDDLFDGTYSKQELRNQLGISTDDKRPILLYAPNWEATSALYKYGERVFEEFTTLPCIVLVKLHYMSLLPIEDHDATLSSENHGNFKKEWVNWSKILEKYQKYNNIIILDNQSLNPWLFLSDIMLTDYGGASLEFICTGKPVIYLDCPEFFDMRGHDIFEKKARNTGYIIDEPKQISETIKRLLIDGKDPHMENRNIMRKKLIYNPGMAAKNGFEKVYEFVRSKKARITDDNMKLRVLYIEENQDGTTGGSHACLLDMVKALDKKKIDPYVMFYESNRLIYDFRALNGKIIIYRRPKPIQFKKLNSLASSFPIKVLIKITKTIINIIRTDIIPFMYFYLFLIYNRIDVIHLNNTMFAGAVWVIAAKLSFTRVVVHERTRISKIHWSNRLHHRWVDYILGMSKSSKVYLEKNGVVTTNYKTFYDRVDVEKFRSKQTKDRTETRIEFDIKPNQPLIGIVGNLQRWKGQLTVVEAVALLKNKYPDIICLLIGDLSKKTLDDQAYYNEINGLISTKDLSGNIILTGHRDDIPDLLNAIDIFVHASLDPEPYGLVVLEAMAMGKAIIASNEGGPVEMIENGKSGVLIEPGNPVLLAENIDSLFSDSRRLKLMGDDALRRVTERFSTLDIGFVQDLYDKLLKSKKK